MASRWGGGGFDVVTSMFAIHYAFESEVKARQMLSNVAGCLKKGGRFIGVCPNSDVITSKVSAFHKKRKEQETAKLDNPKANFTFEYGRPMKPHGWQPFTNAELVRMMDRFRNGRLTTP